MRFLDQQYTRAPFYGIRKMTAQARLQGWVVNHKRVARLLRKLGLTAIYPQASTSTPAPGHRIYPYLLRDVPIVRPDQVWSTDVAGHQELSVFDRAPGSAKGLNQEL